MPKKLYVGGLPWAVTSDELESIFQEHGSVLNAFVVQDRDTGRSKGFGFVEFENNEAANQAMDALNGSDVGGRTITVNEARERQARPHREDSY